MFNALSLASVAFAAAASVSGLVVPRASPPPGWAFGYLEDYTVYHIRYLALGCQNQHGQPFFDQCCHPLLSTEKLETARPPQCIPSASASASASAVEPTSTVTTPADDTDDCEGNDNDDSGPNDDVPTPVPQTTTPPVTSATPPPPPPPQATTHKEAPHDTPKETPAPKTTTSKAAAPTKPASSGSSLTNLITGGFATFFFQNGVAGACGTVHSDNDLIAAMDIERYGNTGVRSSLCGKQVKITNPANNKSVVVTIADACPTCNNGNSIDLSEAAFERIATKEQGMVKIVWEFL